MDGRQVVLNRIRRGLKDVRKGEPAAVGQANARKTGTAEAPVDWVYGQPTPMDDVLGRFVERCADYKARVERVAAADGVPAVVVRCLADAGAGSVVCPPGLNPTWWDAVATAGIAAHGDEPPLSKADLNGIDAVVTTATVGIAETGTIVLSHGDGQGRRVLTLLPDVHVCVVAADQVVSDVPEAITRLRPFVAAGRPLTWISGPSATSDIELARVEGVHGPRTLIVILVG